MHAATIRAHLLALVLAVSVPLALVLGVDIYQDRQQAIGKMREALNAFVIRGVGSNIPFQAALLAHPDFVAGNFNT